MGGGAVGGESGCGGGESGGASGGGGGGGGGDGGDGGDCGGGKSHWAPIAPTPPSWQSSFSTNCEPPFPKELEQVLLQSFGGGGEDGGEDAALVTVTNASSIAMSL
eukprot:scaffold66483_cov51-Phaeocystis_antarctica.AAC.2